MPSSAVYGNFQAVVFYPYYENVLTIGESGKLSERITNRIDLMIRKIREAEY